MRLQLGQHHLTFERLTEAALAHQRFEIAMRGNRARR